jgi:Fic family protein
MDGLAVREPFIVARRWGRSAVEEVGRSSRRRSTASVDGRRSSRCNSRVDAADHRHVEGANMPLLRSPLAHLVQRIQAEFEESPDLTITVREGARFWVIDSETCTRVLTELDDTGYLEKSADGRYKRRRTV